MKLIVKYTKYFVQNYTFNHHSLTLVFFHHSFLKFSRRFLFIYFLYQFVLGSGMSYSIK